MPTYSYKHLEESDCSKGDEFELIQPMAEAALKECPDCKIPVKRILTTVGFSVEGGTPKFH